jgi:hypothetical protein
MKSKKRIILGFVFALTLGLVAYKSDKIIKDITFNEVVITDNYLGWWGRTVADINKDGLMDVMVLKQSRGYGPVNPS